MVPHLPTAQPNPSQSWVSRIQVILLAGRWLVWWALPSIALEAKLGPCSTTRPKLVKIQPSQAQPSSNGCSLSTGTLSPRLIILSITWWLKWTSSPRLLRQLPTHRIVEPRISSLVLQLPRLIKVLLSVPRSVISKLTRTMPFLATLVPNHRVDGQQLRPAPYETLLNYQVAPQLSRTLLLATPLNLWLVSNTTNP